MNMFKPVKIKVEFSEPSNIDFKAGEIFHLSCVFEGGIGRKKIFAKELENLGAKCRIEGHVKKEDTNYLIIPVKDGKGKNTVEKQKVFRSIMIKTLIVSNFKRKLV